MFFLSYFPLKGIVSWLEKRTGLPVLAVNDMETLDKLKGSNAVVVIGVFNDAESDAAKEYVKAAAATEDTKFVITSDENVMKGIKAADGAIVMFKNFDEPRHDYSGDTKSSVSS